MASEKVLLGSSWCRTFGGYWIDGRQACWLAWGNLSLRALLSYPLLFLPFSVLVFAVTDSLGEPQFFGENWIIFLLGPPLDPCVGNRALNLLLKIVI